MSGWVFISHSSADAPIAAAICHEFERLGNRCWMAPRDIRPGSDWAEEIVHAIQSAQYVLLLLSETANRSQQILREVERATAFRVPVLPALIESIELSTSLQYHLGATQWIDAATTAEDKVACIAKAVAAAKRQPDRTGPTTIEPSVIRRYAKNLRQEINNNLVLEMYDIADYEELCIEPLISRTDSSGEPGTPTEMPSLVRVPRALVIGDPGSGKTTALRSFALNLLEPESLEIVPIYVALAAFDRTRSVARTTAFRDFVDEELALLQGPDLRSLEAAAGIQPYLLLDGWDEIPEECRTLVRSYLASSDIAFAITSRPEAQRSLPVGDRFEMVPLSTERVRQLAAIRISDPNKVDKFATWVSADRRLSALAAVPLNLSIMIIVFLEESGSTRSLTKTRLYERAFDSILHQHHRLHRYEGFIAGDSDRTRLLERLLTTVAFETASSGQGRFFSLRQLEDAAEALMGTVPAGLAELLSGRLGIVRDRRAQRFEFFHLWYQEFLAARYVIDNANDIAAALSDARLGSLLPFAAGLLDTDAAVETLRTVEIQDCFDFSRAIGETTCGSAMTQELLVRVAEWGRSQTPKIPVRLEMSRALGQAGIGALAPLAAIASDKGLSDYVRRAALEAVIILDGAGPTLRGLLVDLADDGSPGLQWHVIEQIGNQALLEAAPQLQRFVSSEDAILAGDSLWALSRIEGQGNKDAASVNSAPTAAVDIPSSLSHRIINQLSSPDPHTQGHALRTIGRLQIAEATELLRMHLLDQSNSYRWIVCEAAARVGGVDGVQVLREALADNDARVVIEAMHGLGAVDAPVPAGIIEDMASRIPEETTTQAFAETVGSAALQTLTRLGAAGAPGSSQVWLSRHSATSWNLDGRLQGRKDIGLTEGGRAAAEQMAETVRALGIEVIFSSPAKRAVETAEIYSRVAGIEMGTHDGLWELDHGDWEGLNLDLLKSENPYFMRWMTDPEREAIPGGSETALEASQRGFRAILGIAASNAGRRVLVVGHKHENALLACSLFGRSLSLFSRLIFEPITPCLVPGRYLPKPGRSGE